MITLLQTSQNEMVCFAYFESQAVPYHSDCQQAVIIDHGALMHTSNKANREIIVCLISSYYLFSYRIIYMSAVFKQCLLDISDHDVTIHISVMKVVCS